MLNGLRLFMRETAEMKRFLSPQNQQPRRLVFYSEHAAYGKFFNPVLEALLAQNPPAFSYLTSDPGDPVFDRDSAKICTFYIQSLLGGLLPQIDSRALVMTMPELGHYHIQRSQKGTEHFYLFHALVSTHMIYRKGAFDHYDTLFCAGPHHVEEIRRTEQVYGLKPKKLIEAGYPLLDKITADYQLYAATKVKPSGAVPVVLMAPSWAPQNLMLSCLEPLTRSFIDAGMRVILRPHPEFVKRFPKAVRHYQGRKDFMGQVEWEICPRKENSLFEADVLVTDWSGIALEYVFGTGRPVLFVDTPRKVLNPEYEKLQMEPLEVQLRDQIGLRLSPADAPQAAQKARLLFDRIQDFQQEIRRWRDKSVFCAGRSAQVIAGVLTKS